MPGYQFAHIEMYARSPSRLQGARRAMAGQTRQRGTGGWSARQVLAEALREPGTCPHVEQPQPPEILIGDLAGLADRIDALERDPPRGQRRDTPILMAGVMSAPWKPGEPASVEWRMNALNYLQQQWGDALQAVVAHNDEGYDHLHWYVTAPGMASVKSLHPGAVARAKAAAIPGATPRDQVAAYSAAMRAYQDQYHQVACVHGMARLGPARRRLSREAWKQEQRQAEALANARTLAHELAQQAQAELNRRQAALDRRQSELEHEQAGLERERRRLQLLMEAMTPEQVEQAADRHARLTTSAQPVRPPRPSPEPSVPSGLPPPKHRRP